MIGEFAAYQILIFLFASILILRTFLLYLKKTKSIRELFLALFIWGSFGALGIFPQLSGLIAKITGFQLGINAIYVGSTIFLIYSLIKVLIQNDRIENSITKLVRQQAINDFKNKYLK